LSPAWVPKMIAPHAGSLACSRKCNPVGWRVRRIQRLSRRNTGAYVCAPSWRIARDRMTFRCKSLSLVPSGKSGLSKPAKRFLLAECVSISRRRKTQASPSDHLSGISRYSSMRASDLRYALGGIAGACVGSMNCSLGNRAILACRLARAPPSAVPSRKTGPSRTGSGEGPCSLPAS